MDNLWKTPRHAPDPMPSAKSKRLSLYIDLQDPSLFFCLHLPLFSLALIQFSSYCLLTVPRTQAGHTLTPGPLHKLFHLLVMLSPRLLLAFIFNFFYFFAKTSPSWLLYLKLYPFPNFLVFYV